MHKIYINEIFDGKTLKTKVIYNVVIDESIKDLTNFEINKDFVIIDNRKGEK